MAMINVNTNDINEASSKLTEIGNKLISLIAEVNSVEVSLNKMRFPHLDMDKKIGDEATLHLHQSVALFQYLAQELNQLADNFEKLNG